MKKILLLCVLCAVLLSACDLFGDDSSSGTKYSVVGTWIFSANIGGTLVNEEFTLAENGNYISGTEVVGTWRTSGNKLYIRINQVGIEDCSTFYVTKTTLRLITDLGTSKIDTTYTRKVN